MSVRFHMKSEAFDGTRLVEDGVITDGNGWQHYEDTAAAF